MRKINTFMPRRFNRLRPGRSSASATENDRSPTAPFIETREQLAGYFLIDAKDRDDAIRIAGLVPSARIGSVEVRPLRVVSGSPGE